MNIINKNRHSNYYDNSNYRLNYLNLQFKCNSIELPQSAY